MNELQKEVFYVIINMKSPLNESSIKKICQEVEIQYTEFLNALEETHFAIKQEYTSDYSIQLTSLSEKFFQLQFQKVEDILNEKFKKISNSVDKYLEDKYKVEQEYKTDRTAEAFRNEYAKSAKVYAEKGDISTAIEMYELAIEDDPVNSSLHEKFSWFLLNKTQDYQYAKKLALKSIELNSTNIDATVVLALIYYRLRKIEDGDEYIEKAKKLGRNISFCHLQKGIARYHESKNIADINERITLLDSALKFLESSESKNSKSCGYDYKNLDDATQYIEFTRKSLSILRQKRTRQQNMI